MGEGFDLLKLMREAGKIQEKVSQQQEELTQKRYTAEAGGGMVRATVNGALEVISIEVEDGALDSLGLNSILELGVAALNEALQRARDGVKGDMMSLFQNMAGGAIKGEE